MKTLQVYRNPGVIHTLVTETMVTDAEQYMLWLVKNSEDKSRNFAWARTRRLCLMAFASCFEDKCSGLQAQFLDYHRTYKRFPSKVDFKTPVGKLKIASRHLASYKATGPDVSAFISPTMADGGAEKFILAVLGTHYVSFVGWYDRLGLSQVKDREKYRLNEADAIPIGELWTPQV